MSDFISADRLLEHTAILSSDAYEGRAPGTTGERLTVDYIAARMREIGLQPVEVGGSYLQAVPLVGMRSLSEPLRCGPLGLLPGDEHVTWSRHPVPHVAVEASSVVFVGYGAQASEYDWDDYKGVNLHGSTVIVLVGDPPVPDPENPHRLDPAAFNGRALTYHGRWTAKMEQAGARGAAAVFVVHDTDAAGYPFSVVQGRAAEHFDLRGAHPARCRVEGWLTPSAARRLFSQAGHDFDTLKRGARDRGFVPTDLGVKVSISVSNAVRSVSSSNVVGVISGGDECVLYTAHWDHLGVGLPVDGDPVRHGARDNALAVASLLETARVLSSVRGRSGRSFVFVATTAEEQGLLGAEHHAAFPVFPLDRTAAVLNFEMPNPYGRTRDLIVYGRGLSELDDYAEHAAAEQGRVLADDPMPEQGLYFRSDHFPFARGGVPAMWAGGGGDYIGREPGYGSRMQADYVANRYHKPADRITPDWDLTGAAEDAMVYVEMGRAIREAACMPRWKRGAGFSRGG